MCDLLMNLLDPPLSPADTHTHTHTHAHTNTHPPMRAHTPTHKGTQMHTVIYTIPDLDLIQSSNVEEMGLERFSGEYDKKKFHCKACFDEVFLPCN